MSASATSSNRFPEIPKYDLQEEIGHGGMATVYRAHDQRLERDVAVKVIHKHLRENPEVRRRFVAEAKAVAKLRHRGIVEVYDVSDEDQEERYLVVELIRGYSLRQMLQERTVLPPEVGATMVRTLCEAVQHAHEQGVIHRDIKPENVLIEPPRPPDAAPKSSVPPVGDSAPPRQGSGVSTRKRQVIVKLTDFGIAKVLDAQGVTSTGQILGSPAHMAPEQIEGGEVGPHTDVFALGVLFYECIVGHLPFEGKNPAQVLRRVLEGEYEPADAERPVVGGRWAKILAGALAKDIDQRIPTANDLAAQITAELDALGITDPRGDLVDYFDDPDVYAERMAIELVPRLLDRGEREKRAGAITSAAADFNRALALSPDDMAILKRITNLSAESLWAERGKRIGAIALGSLALFGLAFGLTKVVQGGDVLTAPTASGATAIPPLPTGEPTSAPEASASETPSATVETPGPEGTGDPATEPTGRPSVRPRPKTGPVSSGTAEPEADLSVRKVKFNVHPKGADLLVDGQPVPNWFTTPRELSVGSHSYTATVDGNCCEEKTGGFTVQAPPADDPDAIQNVYIPVPIKKARFVLAGGPPGASVICKGQMSTPGSPSAVTINNVAESVTCTLSDDRRITVTLSAGAQVPIPWPN